MSNTAIKVEHLSKHYKLGVINNGTLLKDIQSFFARLRGKEDPNGKIGTNYIDTSEGFWALKDLNFEINKGDRIGIIGHNGAGKSTLLKILSQVTSPTEGNIRINGKIASLLEVGTGFHPELTGRENIYMNGSILGMKKSEIDRKVDSIIEFSEIAEHIDTPVKRYSSGMYVRLAFAVAAHLDSDILIADEVLAVGDAAFQKKALGKMNQLSEGEGRTVLFVSHNMAQVRNLCNKGIVLKDGCIVRKDNDIDKSIDWYLGRNPDGDLLETTSWHNDGSFTNENFCPQSLRILDEGGKTMSDALDYESGYRIRLDFVSDKPDSNVDFWISIYLGSEIMYKVTMPADFTYKKGANSVDFVIAPRTLPPNNYVISLGSSLKNTKYIINPYNYDLTLFTMVKSTSKAALPFCREI
ncbi:MAG: ATP-binding cassette domain-containing protein [Treponema sp.]|nr:ATP-binding cassette domain-containing protein [Treponema sp.]